MFHHTGVNNEADYQPFIEPQKRLGNNGTLTSCHIVFFCIFAVRNYMSVSHFRRVTVIGSNILSGVFYAHYVTIHGAMSYNFCSSEKIFV